MATTNGYRGLGLAARPGVPVLCLFARPPDSPCAHRTVCHILPRPSVLYYPTPVLPCSTLRRSPPRYRCLQGKHPLVRSRSLGSRWLRGLQGPPAPTPKNPRPREPLDCRHGPREARWGGRLSRGSSERLPGARAAATGQPAGGPTGASTCPLP